MSQTCNRSGNKSLGTRYIVHIEQPRKIASTPIPGKHPPVLSSLKAPAEDIRIPAPRTPNQMFDFVNIFADDVALLAISFEFDMYVNSLE